MEGTVEAVPSGDPAGHAWARRAAWSLWLGAIVLALLGVAYWARSGYAPLPQVFMAPATFLALVAMVLAQATGGLILAIRRPDLNIGFLILGFSLAVAPAATVNGYVSDAAVNGGPLDPDVAAWLAGSLTFPVATFFATILGLSFPTGRLISPAWRWAVLLATVAMLVELGALLLTPGRLVLLPGFVNPVVRGDPTPIHYAVRDLLGPSLMSLAATLTAGALVQRYRSSDEVGRLQIRWYVAAGILLVLGFFGFVVARVIFPRDDPFGAVLTTAFYVSATLPPAAIVFAILRYRLYGIDTILGRAFVYGALTAFLAGVYAASIRLFNFVFVSLTGEDSEAALVLTTLILATSFTPVKKRLEDIADRYIKPRSEASASDGLLSDPAFVHSIEEIARRVVHESRQKEPRGR